MLFFLCSISAKPWKLLSLVWIPPRLHLLEENSQFKCPMIQSKQSHLSKPVGLDRFTRELLFQSLEIFHKWRTTNDLAAKSELRIKGPWYQQLSSGFCSLRLTWLRIKCIWEETGKATKRFRGTRKFVKAAATKKHLAEALKFCQHSSLPRARQEPAMSLRAYGWCSW